MDHPRVLVVDDDSSIRRLVSKVLQLAEYTVEEAVDGADAIEKVDARPYDAMVLDLMMPRVDGFSVLEHLHDAKNALAGRTVVMTAYPRIADQRLDESCVVLRKPFNLEQLVAALRRCVTVPGLAQT
jgi:CheY-like chemotaxis protein